MDGKKVRFGSVGGLLSASLILSGCMIDDSIPLKEQDNEAYNAVISEPFDMKNVYNLYNMTTYNGYKGGQLTYVTSDTAFDYFLFLDPLGYLHPIAERKGLVFANMKNALTLFDSEEGFNRYRVTGLNGDFIYQEKAGIRKEDLRESIESNANSAFVLTKDATDKLMVVSNTGVSIIDTDVEFKSPSTMNYLYVSNAPNKDNLIAAYNEVRVLSEQHKVKEISSDSERIYDDELSKTSLLDSTIPTGKITSERLPIRISNGTSYDLALDSRNELRVIATPIRTSNQLYKEIQQTADIQNEEFADLSRSERNAIVESQLGVLNPEGTSSEVASSDVSSSGMSGFLTGMLVMSMLGNSNSAVGSTGIASGYRSSPSYEKDRRHVSASGGSSAAVLGNSKGNSVRAMYKASPASSYGISKGGSLSTSSSKGGSGSGFGASGGKGGSGHGG